MANEFKVKNGIKFQDGTVQTTAAAAASSQAANTVYAGPDGSAGSPSFRALVAADIPVLTLQNLPDAWVKRSVRVATTANITLSGTQTIDGIAVVAGDRVLVKDQSTASQNGIYIVSATAWSRAPDADLASEMAAAVVGVDSGTVNGGLNFDNDFKSTDTLGTTSMIWSRLVDTGLASSTSPAMNGTATIGTSINYARADHIHPTDTSRAPSAGSTSITTLGTIGTGTWQGSLISSTYGGTGVNNGGRTLTINTNSGTLTFTNASTTLTVANTASVSGTNTGDQTITLTGEVTGSGTGSFATTLSTTAVVGKALTGYAVGTNTALAATDTIVAAFGKVQAQINAKGAGTVTSIVAGTGLSGGTITSTGTIALANTTVTAGSYTNANITVDAQGRITAASNGSAAGGVTSFNTRTGAVTLSSSDVTTALGYTPINIAGATLGGGTFTKVSGSTTGGNLAFDNGTTDTPGVTFYYAASTNFGIDAASSTLRFVKNMNETGGAVVGSFDTSGNFTATSNVTAYSDETLKRAWSDVEADFIERLAQVKSGTYTRIDTGERQAGSSAQDWKVLLPEVVKANEEGILSLAYGNAALVSAVELAKRVVEQDKRIAELEAKLNKLLGV